MVPLTKRSLVLPASPPSVKLARSWVSSVLAEIGRDDLVDAAAARRLRAGHQRADPLPAAAVGAGPRHRRPPPHRGGRLLARPAAAHRGRPRARGRRRLQRDHVRPRPRPGRDDVEPVGLRPRPRRPQQVGVVRAAAATRARGRPSTARSSTSTPTSLDGAGDPRRASRADDHAAARAAAAVRRAAPLPLRDAPRAAAARDDLAGGATRWPTEITDDLRPGRPRAARQRRGLAASTRRSPTASESVDLDYRVPAQHARDDGPHPRPARRGLPRVLRASTCSRCGRPTCWSTCRTGTSPSSSARARGEQPQPWDGPTSMPRCVTRDRPARRCSRALAAVAGRRRSAPWLRWALTAGLPGRRRATSRGRSSRSTSSARALLAALPLLPAARRSAWVGRLPRHRRPRRLHHDVGRLGRHLRPRWTRVTRRPAAAYCWARWRPPCSRCCSSTAGHVRTGVRGRARGGTSDRAAGGPGRRPSARRCGCSRRTARTAGCRWGTLRVNLVGSLVLGALVGAAVDGPRWRCWAPGSAAALTTYSAFAVQTVHRRRAAERRTSWRRWAAACCWPPWGTCSQRSCSSVHPMSGFLLRAPASCPSAGGPPTLARSRSTCWSWTAGWSRSAESLRAEGLPEVRGRRPLAGARGCGTSTCTSASGRSASQRLDLTSTRSRQEASTRSPSGWSRVRRTAGRRLGPPAPRPGPSQPTVSGARRAGRRPGRSC